VREPADSADAAARGFGVAGGSHDDGSTESPSKTPKALAAFLESDDEMAYAHRTPNLEELMRE
jgi:hypothetical protein